MVIIDNISTPKKYTLDISLWLDDYDDIYSDFDSRNYLKRRISSDFLDELRVAMKNQDETINDLILLIPQEKRNKQAEQNIIHNLTSYFKHQLAFNKEKYISRIKKGTLLFFLAVTLMIVNSILNFSLGDHLISSIIRIVLEPSGWFLIWVAFDMLYYDVRMIKKEKLFFTELSKIKIYFQSSDAYITNE